VKIWFSSSVGAMGTPGRRSRKAADGRLRRI
jgi:hypothetical protein